jgi:hypothetical protein
MSNIGTQNISELLGKEALNSIEEFNIHEEELSLVSDEVTCNFNTILHEAQKSLLTPEMYLIQKLTDAETYIKERNDFGNPATVAGVSRTAASLLKKSFNATPEGFFLKRKKITELLNEHPPHCPTRALQYFRRNNTQ